MIWGVRLFPGQESRHLVSNQLHLTLASLDCRPGKTCGGSAAYLLMKTLSCENVICTLEKGQTNQQQLDLVLQPGEQVTFKVEGNGHVYLTGYSWIGPDSCRDHLNVPDTRSIYTGLLPSLQENPSDEYKQHSPMKKSTEQESKLGTQTIRQVQSIQLNSSRSYGQPKSSDKGWILEEDPGLVERPSRTVNNEVLNDHRVMPEELVTIVDQSVEESDDSIEDLCTTLQSNEATSIKYSEVASDGNRLGESGINESGGSFAREEQTPDADGGVACERESNDRAPVLLNSEPQGDSYEHLSDEETQCKAGDQHKGQSCEAVSDGKVQYESRSELHQQANEEPSSNMNEGPKYIPDGESLHMLEKESLTGTVNDLCSSEVEKLESSHQDSEDPDGIFTVVVEDVNSAPTTSGNRTEMMEGSNSDQVPTLEVKAETDNSDNIILYHCQICGKVLSSKDSFRIHTEMHGRGDQIAPRAQYLNQANDVTEHSQKYAGESNETCQLSDNVDRNSSSHLNVEGMQTPNRVLHECQYCGKVVSSKASLKVHMSLHPEHTGETEKKLDESLRCQLCGKYFSNISNRRRHEKMHTNGKSFKCHVCGKQLQNKWYLNEHLRIHTEETLQKCQFCEKVFRGEGNKNRHEKMHFGVTIPFECRYCGKTFESPSGGRRHEAMHTGNRAYKCRFCDKTFNDRRCRESHEGRVHTGERLYKCQMCVKSFYGKSDLDVHMRVHTGEKPYKCRFCDELFTYHTSARRHEAKHVEGSI